MRRAHRTNRLVPEPGPDRRVAARLDLADGAVVHGDASRLVQAASNLLTNAARYTPEGGEVEVSVTREGDEAVLRVVDDGLGLDPELLPRLFELFTQGMRTADRSEGGLGIGLALVKSLVELHEGSVSASSEGPGRGSQFEIRLPVAPSRTAEESRVEPPPEEAKSAATRPHTRRVTCTSRSCTSPGRRRHDRRCRS